MPTHTDYVALESGRGLLCLKKYCQKPAQSLQASRVQELKAGKDD